MAVHLDKREILLYVFETLKKRDIITWQYICPLRVSDV
jgi:hypothetical protein